MLKNIQSTSDEHVKKYFLEYLKKYPSLLMLSCPPNNIHASKPQPLSF
jgi:adenine-specific DNA glycosylase